MRRVADLPQQVGRDQPEQDPGAGGGVRQEVPEKTQARLSVVRASAPDVYQIIVIIIYVLTMYFT